LIKRKETGLDIMRFSANAKQVLRARYLARDEHGQIIETPEQMFRRVARSIARADKLYDKSADIKATEAEFYDLMSSLDFLPNSPCLMNAGRRLQQLSACFVIPIDDSMESIFEAVKNTALILQTGGGTGFDFSDLRPRDDIVKSTKGVSSGPVSFMDVFNAATEAIRQGGTRRGANMAILRVDHPDILDFIRSKKDLKKLTNFNISVAITDAFMRAYKDDRRFSLINPRTKKKAKDIGARYLFNEIAKSAWSCGDPGIVFIDRINRSNPTPRIGRIASTNPCGEVPLLPHEACNLGSINLSRMLAGRRIDYDKIKRSVHTAVHFLDNVIDANRYPVKEIEMMTKGNRKIGLGVMGFADMLIQLGIRYDSRKAEALGEKLMRFIRDEARYASLKLARRRGVFPNYKGSIYERKGLRLRNATLTTIAPTGTISIIAGCSSGIEPLFGIVFKHYVLEKKTLLEVNGDFERIARERGFYSRRLFDKITKTGSLKGMPGLPPEIKSIFRTAHDIQPAWHIKIQAAFQKFTDNSVSKTINMPKGSSVDDVKKAFLLAYELGCKGLTVYRYASRPRQVLKTI
jgi:ribonucleoside-diphosphate reductase alpha chain